MKGYNVNLQDVSKEHLEEANEAINRNLESLALKHVTTENLVSVSAGTKGFDQWCGWWCGYVCGTACQIIRR